MLHGKGVFKWKNEKRSPPSLCPSLWNFLQSVNVFSVILRGKKAELEPQHEC